VVAARAAAPAQTRIREKKPSDDPFNAAFAFPKKITLDEEQQAKLEELRKSTPPSSRNSTRSSTRS